MLIQQNRNGVFHILACGTAVFNAKVFNFQSGKSKTIFTLVVDKNAEGNVDLVCHAWEKLGTNYASGIEKGDKVLVAGVLKIDNYQTEKKGSTQYFLDCEMIMVQPYFEIDEE